MLSAEDQGKISVEYDQLAFRPRLLEDTVQKDNVRGLNLGTYAKRLRGKPITISRR